MNQATCFTESTARMKIFLALMTTLLLAGCASDDTDYSSRQDSPTVHLAKPAGEPGAAVKQTF